MFKKLLVFLVLCFSLTSAVLNVNITADPAFDTESKIVTTNLSAIGGTNASKECIGAPSTICTYGINGTFSIPYSGLLDANYSVLFTQNDIAAIGNISQGYINSTGSKIAICTQTNALLPTTPTNISCNMTANVSTPSADLYTDIVALVTTTNFTYDYSQLSLTANVTAITSLPYSVSSSGTYVLTQNLSNGSNGVTVGASNVLLDCLGFKITGNYTNVTYGIITTGNNITTQNCIVERFGTAYLHTEGNNTTVKDNLFNNSSQTSVVIGSVGIVNNMNMNNNLIENGFNNGIEIYYSNNSIYTQNAIYFHEHGHGTDRAAQFVRNVFNTEFSFNEIYNNTLCFRSDNNNVTNVSIHNNNCYNNSNGLNMLASVGSFSAFNVSDNTFTGYTNGVVGGFDMTWPASSTKESDCAQITANNNTVSGGPYYFYNKASGENQTIANLNVGGMAFCDSDNIRLNNITLNGYYVGYNALEFMNINNATVSNIWSNLSRVTLRVLSVNDSTFTNITANGAIIGAINGNGGFSNRNNISNCVITNVSTSTAITFGGANNSIKHCIVGNSTSSLAQLLFGGATTTANITYENISVYNAPIGFGFTLISSTINSNLIDVYFENTTLGVLINSSVSGTKTYCFTNVSFGFSNTVNRTYLNTCDTVAASEVYSISMGSVNSSYPTNKSTYYGKMLSIVNYAGGSNITSGNITWTDQEAYDSHESNISLWKYNSSANWTQLSGSLDIATNTMGFSGLVINSGETMLFGLLVDTFTAISDFAAPYAIGAGIITTFSIVYYLARRRAYGNS